jgi:co-chaperonin GroES (HSP10)
LAAIDRAKTEYPPFKGRILGCRVLLVRIEENWTHSGRFLLPDTYQHGSVQFRVLAVGPGEWVKIGKKRIWIPVEVAPGDCVISRHWVQAQDPRNATWHQPQFLDNVDGSGRVIVDTRFCELLWKQ